MPESLESLVTALGAIAPPALAAPWDNTGLLVEPPGNREITKIAITIDLTEPVLDEALHAGADAIVAYHPPIFAGVKRLVLANPQSRVLMRCIQAQVAVYSPHTALDAAPGGMNDWLIDGLGPVASRAAIEPAPTDLVGDGVVAGVGRSGALAEPAPLAVLIRRAKAWLDLSQVRVAAPPEHAAGQPLRRVAVCPGAGGSVFDALQGPVDLLVTGELRHHDVLAWVARGTSVILTDHTNTERGFLGILGQRLEAALPGVATMLCRRDRDPLAIH